MKKFENPTMDIEELKILDVITVSCGEDCPDDCPDDCDGYDCPTGLAPWSLRRFLG